MNKCAHGYETASNGQCSGECDVEVLREVLRNYPGTDVETALIHERLPRLLAKYEEQSRTVRDLRDEAEGLRDVITEKHDFITELGVDRGVYQRRAQALLEALRHIVIDFDDGDARGDSSVDFDVDQARKLLPGSRENSYTP